MAVYAAVSALAVWGRVRATLGFLLFFFIWAMVLWSYFSQPLSARKRTASTQGRKKDDMIEYQVNHEIFTLPDIDMSSSSSSMWSSSIPPSDIRTVYYDPQNPSNASLSQPMPKGAVIICSILFVIALAIMIGAFMSDSFAAFLGFSGIWNSFMNHS